MDAYFIVGHSKNTVDSHNLEHSRDLKVCRNVKKKGYNLLQMVKKECKI